MALDEALLESGPDFVLRFYRWSSRPAATFGYFQKHEQVTEILRSFGPPWDDPTLPAVRRPTGGGLVLHDDDLTFSLVFRRDGTLTPQAIYRNIHRGAHLGLKKAGIATSLWSPPGWRDRPRCPADQCFTGPEPMDLVLESGRKVLGGALRRRGMRVLYQGSLRLPKGNEPERIEAALTQGTVMEWAVAFSAAPAGDAIQAAAQRLKEKYAGSDWNERR